MGRGEIDFRWLMGALIDSDRRLILELYSKEDVRLSFEYLGKMMEEVEAVDGGS